MVNARLVLLRWKMESRAWLEAMWEGRWFGIALTGICAMVCVYLQWEVPGPGVSVAVMGVAAALMTARTKASGAEKVVWMLIITSLLLSEVLAIRKDRAAHDDQLANILREEVEARRESKAKFRDIGNGINDQSQLSQKQFKATVQQQSQQFEATMKKAQIGIDEMTGGDSYAIVFPFVSSATDNTFKLHARLCDKCEYSLQHVSISMQTVDQMSLEISKETMIYQGMIDHDYLTSLAPATVSPAPTGETTYKFTILSRSKPILEDLKVRFNPQLKKWEYSWHIVREEKPFHLTKGKDKAVARVVRVLEDQDWTSDVTVPFDFSTVTVKPH